MEGRGEGGERGRKGGEGREGGSYVNITSRVVRSLARRFSFVSHSWASAAQILSNDRGQKIWVENEIMTTVRNSIP